VSSPESAKSFAELRTEIEIALGEFLENQRAQLAAIGTELDSVSTGLTEYVLNGGKRLRPLFAYWGFRGAGGIPNSSIICACASLELIQACALIHDDVMDGSDTRRGNPAIHKRFASLHRAQGLSGDSEGFGLSSAILLGDLALVWADKMFHTSNIDSDALLRSLSVFDEMRVEIMAGQYLDVLEQAPNIRLSARFILAQHLLVRSRTFLIRTRDMACRSVKPSNFAMTCSEFLVTLMRPASQRAMTYVKANELS
jgi:geranylgeranyl diphosphate synthase type I